MYLFKELAVMEKEEYELTLFGFSVQQISTERRYLLKKIIESILDSVRRKFSKAEGVQELLAGANLNITENIWNKFKQYLKNLDSLDVKYFSIPSNVLLPTDFDLAKKYTEEDEAQQNAQLEHLKHEFLENAVWLELLKLEYNCCKILDNVMNEESEIQQQLQQLTNAFDMKILIGLVDICEIITRPDLNTDHFQHFN